MAVKDLSFGQRVKAAREARQWVQRDLADRLAQRGVGVKEAHIGHIETDRRNPSVPTIVALIEELEIEPGEVVLLEALAQLHPEVAPSLRRMLDRLTRVETSTKRLGKPGESSKKAVLRAAEPRRRYRATQRNKDLADVDTPSVRDGILDVQPLTVNHLRDALAWLPRIVPQMP